MQQKRSRNRRATLKKIQHGIRQSLILPEEGQVQNHGFEARRVRSDMFRVCEVRIEESEELEGRYDEGSVRSLFQGDHGGGSRVRGQRSFGGRPRTTRIAKNIYPKRPQGTPHFGLNRTQLTQRRKYGGPRQKNHPTALERVRRRTQ